MPMTVPLATTFLFAILSDRLLLGDEQTEGRSEQQGFSLL
jgi:hypothetical protein